MLVLSECAIVYSNTTVLLNIWLTIQMHLCVYWLHTWLFSHGHKCLNQICEFIAPLYLHLFYNWGEKYAKLFYGPKTIIYTITWISLSPVMSHYAQLMNRQFLLGSANVINRSIGSNAPVRFDRIGKRTYTMSKHKCLG